MNTRLIYMTAGSREEARSIGKLLVESRLAACVNILGPVNSLYMWEGRLEDADEFVLIAKTVAERVPQLVDAVKGAHSYDCPCVVSLQVDDGHSAFLDWIAGQVRLPANDGS
jgi:periplasmic divalent cation tolerance protein